VSEADAAARAFMALALRLWCGDGPEEPMTVAGIDEWADAIPSDERAALNAMLGENFGKWNHWDADEGIQRWVRRQT